MNAKHRARPWRDRLVWFAWEVVAGLVGAGVGLLVAMLWLRGQ